MEKLLSHILTTDHILVSLTSTSENNRIVSSVFKLARHYHLPHSNLVISLLTREIEKSSSGSHKITIFREPSIALDTLMQIIKVQIPPGCNFYRLMQRCCSMIASVEDPLESSAISRGHSKSTSKHVNIRQRLWGKPEESPEPSNMVYDIVRNVLDTLFLNISVNELNNTVSYIPSTIRQLLGNLCLILQEYGSTRYQSIGLMSSMLFLRFIIPVIVSCSESSNMVEKRNVMFICKLLQCSANYISNEDPDSYVCDQESLRGHMDIIRESGSRMRSFMDALVSPNIPSTATPVIDAYTLPLDKHSDYCNRVYMHYMRLMFPMLVEEEETKGKLVVGSWGRAESMIPSHSRKPSGSSYTGPAHTGLTQVDPSVLPRDIHVDLPSIRSVMRTASSSLLSNQTPTSGYALISKSEPFVLGSRKARRVSAPSYNVLCDKLRTLVLRAGSEIGMKQQMALDEKYAVTWDSYYLFSWLCLVSTKGTTQCKCKYVSMSTIEKLREWKVNGRDFLRLNYRTSKLLGLAIEEVDRLMSIRDMLASIAIVNIGHLHRNVEEWSMYDVIVWLYLENMEIHSHRIYTEDIDGGRLKMMGVDDLKMIGVYQADHLLRILSLY